MAAPSKTMHQIRQILELRHRGFSIKKVVRLSGASRNTVREYLRQAAATGMSLEGLLALDNGALQQLLFGDAAPKTNTDPRWADLEGRLDYLMGELRRRGVTKHLLWEEYRASDPPQGGYGYSQFCHHVQQHLQRRDAVMYFRHQAGERLMVDFAGAKLRWIDPVSAEEHWCEVLVCVLPFSALTYAEALPSQRQEDFIQGICNALDYIGGAPLCIKCDNLRSAVVRASRYEPTFTEAMEQLAAHYGLSIWAARPYQPRDKASVENAVDKVYMRIFAPLRDRTFHSPAQLNAAIRTQLDWHNALDFKGKNFSRRNLFEREEKSLLKALPPTPYELRRITYAKVQKNYHVILGEDRHQYSVPFQLIGKRLKLVYTTHSVEAYEDLVRVAVHRRDRRQHAYTTLADHMPPKHRHMASRKGWSAEYFLSQAEKIGPSTAVVFQKILTSKAFYEQTYNACLGILRLSQRFGNDRLEATCSRVLNSSAAYVNYTMLANILQNKLDQSELLFPPQPPPSPPHENLRGPTAYQ